jgi:hypothetical protein
MFLSIRITYNLNYCKMKNFKYLLIVLFFSLGFHHINAQSTSISKSLGLYAFPAKNQDAKTQEADETACFNWAKQQTGYDPMNPTKVTAAPVDTSPDGTAVKGAAKGAAAGAAIGAIAGDTGQGAAIGAVVGVVGGRRAKKSGDAKEQQQSTQAASQKQAQMLTDYKNAYTACLEGKGYTVK